MRIGELARQARTDVETVRYYEKAGLLDEPGRNTAGYREYRDAHRERLQFIRHCRSLQMPLADIRMLLDLQEHPATGCQRVNDLLDRHIHRIREQVRALRLLETRLAALRRACCEPGAVHECPILRNLAETGEGSACACHAAVQPNR